MTGNYFVMLNTQGGGYTPMVNDDDIATFDTAEEAQACAELNPLGAHFGFEIFERGTGLCR